MSILLCPPLDADMNGQSKVTKASCQVKTWTYLPYRISGYSRAVARDVATTWTSGLTMGCKINTLDPALDKIGPFIILF